jgi:hypothetical protein
MKRMRLILIAMGLMAMSFPASASTIVVTFTLSPSNGLVAGPPGTSVGWGYTVSTNADYVTIESITFGDETPVGIFSTPGIPFTAATSTSPITSPWAMNISGLQYDISGSELVGASSQGIMTLTYDAFTDSTETDQIVFGDTVNAQTGRFDAYSNPIAEVDVTPEPGSTGLIGMGCAALAMLWGARRRRSG